mgnify:CR=1 FL=1
MEQKVIKQMNNWLGNRVEAFSDEDLREMFLEISDFRRTGLLTGPSKLRKFEREFSDHVQNHDLQSGYFLRGDEIMEKGIWFTKWTAGKPAP